MHVLSIEELKLAGKIVIKCSQRIEFKKEFMVLVGRRN